MGASKVIDVPPIDESASDPLVFQASREMVKHKKEGEDIVMDIVFHREILLNLRDFDVQFDRLVDRLMSKIKDFVKLGSGWFVQNIESLV